MEKEVERLDAEIVELQARVFALERALTWVLAQTMATSSDFGRKMESQARTAESVSDGMKEVSKLMAQTHVRGLQLYQDLLREAGGRVPDLDDSSGAPT